ncbi:MAG: L-aspartate oxidase [Acidobacteria bacterium]|nr:L-aspartate oxidase [Acidobacteriota bacterium]
MRKPVRNPDFIVIGAGITGVRAAIELAPHGQVAVLTKSKLQDTNTEFAQGGIAVAMGGDDEVGLHFDDTIRAGDGLCDEKTVWTLVEEGPARIQELIDWGTPFDQEGGKLAFGREAAHTQNRILHAGGDSTGREIHRTLIGKVLSLESVHLMSESFVLDLLMEAGKCRGVTYLNEETSRVRDLTAQAVLLATGGLGVLYPATTNPDIATGDGCALAFRAGASLADMEFVQFHPTVLKLPGAPPFLLSEALRGEGGRLRNANGELFMSRYHPHNDLATRDVVSRSILAECQRLKSDSVFLDATGIDSEFLQQRFPRIFQTCLEFGLDITREYIPVYPAAHYIMGGVLSDGQGRTTRPGLFAAGEVACNGVHGANRLASNSLLEGLVFGARTGRAMVQEPSSFVPKQRDSLKIDEWPVDQTASPSTLKEAIQAIAHEDLGAVRSKEGLESALAGLLEMSFSVHPKRSDQEINNLLSNARLVAGMALVRQESRGAHHRTDYPSRNDPVWRRRITARYDSQKAKVIYEALPITRDLHSQQSIDSVTIS